jgi:hypothetical protein
VLSKMTSLNVLLKHIRSMIHSARNQAGTLLAVSTQHPLLYVKFETGRQRLSCARSEFGGFYKK